MARKKRIENETPEAELTRKKLEAVANHATRSEKTAWMRKYKNMQLVYNDLKPIEDQILSLMVEKQVFTDKLTKMRNIMVEECVHPLELLSLKEKHIECKFCNRKISIPKNVKL